MTSGAASGGGATATAEPLTSVVGVEDMVHLPELTEASLLVNLRVRYQADLIYVHAWTGRGAWVARLAGPARED